MKQGKFESRRRRNPGVFAALIALMLTLCCATGGTIAWLTSTSDSVASTFVIGNINITLSDAKNVLKAGDANAIAVSEGATYTPGTVIEADPKVTVAAGSEACFLFIHIEEENNSFGSDGKQVIQWSLEGLKEGDNDEGYTWKAVASQYPGYYFVKLNKADVKDGKEYHLFKDNKLTVNGDLTKDVVDAEGFGSPSITITAAAVQKENIPDSNNDSKITWRDAWEILPEAFKPAAGGN